MFSGDPPMGAWQERVDMLRPRASDAGTILAVLARAGRYDAVVLDGSARRDQVAAALLRLRRRRPAIVIANATWKSNTNHLDVSVNRAGIRLIDGPRTSFCVHSSFETESFPRTWRLRYSRVRFTPRPFTLSELELRKPAGDNGRVFAGGNSLRDYAPLIAAASQIAAPIDIATSALSPAQLRSCPENVTVRAAGPAEYEDMLRSAAVVVVPLAPRPDRSSGQSTYVHAMARGKAIVVTDAPGVRDYIDGGQTGVIVPPGDSRAMGDAVRRLLDDPDERRRLGARAREHALGYTLSDYAAALLAVVDETLSAPAPRRAT